MIAIYELGGGFMTKLDKKKPWLFGGCFAIAILGVLVLASPPARSAVQGSSSGPTLRSVTLSSGVRLMSNTRNELLLGTLGQPLTQISSGASGFMLFQGVHQPGGIGGVREPRPHRSAAFLWELYE